MKFETIAISAANNAILAHSLRLSGLTLSKGRRLDAADLDALAARGIREITVAQLEAADVGENEAASRAAVKLTGPVDAEMRAGQRRFGAVILAAGRSSRMGHNKLLINIDGRPLVRRVAEMVLAAGFDKVVAVIGHEAERLRAALSGLDLEVAENDDYEAGLSTSLQRGIAALGAEVDAAMICLGDMPDVDAELLRHLLRAFNPVEGRAIVVPVRAGKRGNPVLWGRQFFTDLMSLNGDVGARHLIGDHTEWVAEVTVENDAVFTDLDTPEAVAEWKAR